MNRNIVNMPDPREEEMLRRALADMAQEEIRAAAQDNALDAEYERTLPGVQAHIARRTESAPRRMRRSLRAVALIVAVLVTFSGVCLASPEIRENLFTLVENTVGGYTQLRVESTGTPEAADSPVTVDADDPRLAYVHPDWCLHYYPLEIPRYYSSVETSYVESPTDTLMTRVDEAGNEWVEPSGFYYLTDDFREMWLERDRQMITFRTVDGDGYYEFIEDGAANSRYDVDTKLDEMNIEIIDGKEVYVIERSGGDTTFVWQEGDHMLTLTSNDFRYQMEYVFSTIERIR